MTNVLNVEIEKGPLWFSCKLCDHKSFESSKTKDVQFSNHHAQVNVITSSQNLIRKEVKLHSLKLMLLFDTGS